MKINLFSENACRIVISKGGGKIKYYDNLSLGMNSLKQEEELLFFLFKKYTY